MFVFSRTNTSQLDLKSIWYKPLRRLVVSEEAHKKWLPLLECKCLGCRWKCSWGRRAPTEGGLPGWDVRWGFFPPEFSWPLFDQVEDFLTDQDVQESWKFEDFGGQRLLADHVENIRVEWSASYPSRVFATATKRLLIYKQLGMGIYNDMEDEDEEGDEEESVLASTWWFSPMLNSVACGWHFCSRWCFIMCTCGIFF